MTRPRWEEGHLHSGPLVRGKLWLSKHLADLLAMSLAGPPSMCRDKKTCSLSSFTFSSPCLTSSLKALNLKL